MKTLVDFIIEHSDTLGHDLSVGDFIEFSTSGFSVYGQIQEITDDEKPKYVVKSLGWLGDESLKSKVKEIYKVNVNAKHVFKVNLSQEYVDVLKNKGVIK